MTERKDRQDLSERLLKFAVAVIRFLKTLPCSIENDVIRNQLAKCSSSMGANYEESQAASSKADFYNKIKISLRESKETKYWLKMLGCLKLGDQKELSTLYTESIELSNILGSISSKQIK
jgi:four helix bundle protein